MILGMSVGAFTILHVIITLVAIGSGLIVVGGMFASNRLPVTTAIFSLHNGAHQLDWISFSYPWLHAGFGCRNCGLCDLGCRAV